MRFFVILATLGTLAACNTGGAPGTVGIGTNPHEDPVDRIASPTEGFETQTGVE